MPLSIKKVEVENFRLLQKVSISFEPRTTVIVGRNNSGKTSLTELFRRILSDSDSTSRLRLEDISLGVHENFWKAFELWKKDPSSENLPKIRESIPVVKLTLTVGYDDDDENLGFLSEFIVDLNPDCRETFVVVEYGLEDGKITDLFKDVDLGEGDLVSQKKIFFALLQERVNRLYLIRAYAEDPNDSTNRKVVDIKNVKSLVQAGFINAQRGLDDVTHRDKGVLAKVLEELFKVASRGDPGSSDHALVVELEAAVKDIQNNIGLTFGEKVKGLLPALKTFGYPGLAGQDLHTETTLDVERLLTEHTKVKYQGVNGISLPESYNGLGSRNLIFILLRLLSFFKEFASKQSEPGVHVVFIEEPEAHLHPQMQEIFIKKLDEIVAIFAKTYGIPSPWPVQFVVTTHSSHLANQASFGSMRYFLPIPAGEKGLYSATLVKDLKSGLSGVPGTDRDFLHKYMTLTKCDLLFADKAILVEGTSERLLFSQMIAKFDASLAEGLVGLSSQYMSLIEVGGAHAHLFFPLLKFLEIPTLIITNLDSYSEKDKKKCIVSESGATTTNSCIKKWFPQDGLTVADLLLKSSDEKTKELVRLTYEIPEKKDEPCGRSFEGAFILANQTLFAVPSSSFSVKENFVWDEAKKIEKTNFALKYGVEETDEWLLPKYIFEGFTWLHSFPVPRLNQGDLVSTLISGTKPKKTSATKKKA